MNEKVYGKKLLELIPKLDYLIELMMALHKEDCIPFRREPLCDLIMEVRDTIQEETSPAFQMKERNRRKAMDKCVNSDCRYYAGGECDHPNPCYTGHNSYEPICGTKENDLVNHPNHYAGNIEVIDYIRDKLTPEGFTEYCCGNVMKYISRWRKKDGVQDLKKAKVYLEWMVESAEKEGNE